MGIAWWQRVWDLHSRSRVRVKTCTSCKSLGQPGFYSLTWTHKIYFSRRWGFLKSKKKKKIIVPLHITCTACVERFTVTTVQNEHSLCLLLLLFSWMNSNRVTTFIIVPLIIVIKPCLAWMDGLFQALFKETHYSSP